MGDLVCMDCARCRSAYAMAGCPRHTCCVCGELGSSQEHPECADHLAAVLLDAEGNDGVETFPRARADDEARPLAGEL